MQRLRRKLRRRLHLQVSLMSLPEAARWTKTIGARADGSSEFAGFVTPGPCQAGGVPGDVCRPRWVNRQDHGQLTRVNIARERKARAQSARAKVYRDCPQQEYSCGNPELRTMAYGPGYAGSREEARRQKEIKSVLERAKARTAARRSVQQLPPQQVLPPQPVPPLSPNDDTLVDFLPMTEVPSRRPGR